MLKPLFKPHRSSLKAHTSDPQKVFVMLKLIPQAELTYARLPLALALVIDTSSSMRLFADQKLADEEIRKKGLHGKPLETKDLTYQTFDLSLPTKLDEAIKAAHALIDHNSLVPDDQLTLIHFDDRAETLLTLTPLSNKQAAHKAVDTLRQYSGGTYMGKGMSLAQQQLGNLESQVVKRLLLLTDGETFDEPECRSLAFQFAESNTPLIAIGIGTEYNEDLLLKLSEISQGRPYHLKNMEKLTGFWMNEVRSSVREVVTNLQATVSTIKGVTLNSLTRIYPSLAEVTLSGNRYRLGNIAAGDNTIFIFEFTISGIARSPSRLRIAQVKLLGYSLELGRWEEFSIQHLFINFTTDEAAVAAVDPEVLGYVRQKNVDRMTQDAMQQVSKDPAQARQTLQVVARMTKQLGNQAVTKMLENALDELNNTGTISPNTIKTVRVGGRTKTIKTGSPMSLEGPSLEDIRRITGA